MVIYLDKTSLNLLNGVKVLPLTQFFGKGKYYEFGQTFDPEIFRIFDLVPGTNCKSIVAKPP